MSPQFQRVHFHPQHPIIDQFPQHLFFFSKVFKPVLPTTQFAYRKCLGTCDALLCVAHTLLNALEMGQKAKIFQIDFSAAFDRVNHQGILFKLCPVGVGGSVLSVVTQFLSNRSQYVVVDECRSKLVNVVSGVPQGSVLGP